MNKVWIVFRQSDGPGLGEVAIIRDSVSPATVVDECFEVEVIFFC
jgi:hypothetical protein